MHACIYVRRRAYSGCQQLVFVLNLLCLPSRRHQTQKYIAKDYAVIPLGARSGLIQWVDAVTPLFGIYKRWQQREAYAKVIQQVSEFTPSFCQPCSTSGSETTFYTPLIAARMAHEMNKPLHGQ